VRKMITLVESNAILDLRSSLYSKNNIAEFLTSMTDVYIEQYSKTNKKINFLKKKLNEEIKHLDKNCDEIISNLLLTSRDVVYREGKSALIIKLAFLSSLKKVKDNLQQTRDIVNG